jgi:hypothetical protein
LDFCRHWLSRSPACRTATLWFSAAAYTAQSQQFAAKFRDKIITILAGKITGSEQSIA